MNSLFPHKVQTIAMLVLLIDIIVVFSLVSISVFNHTPTGEVVQSTLLVIAYLAVFFCVFSKEKQENKFISFLRLNSVAIVSGIALLSIIVLNIIQLVLPQDGYIAMKEWRMNHFWNGNFVVKLALLYLLIFKISIRCNNR